MTAVDKTVEALVGTHRWLRQTAAGEGGQEERGHIRDNDGGYRCHGIRSRVSHGRGHLQRNSRVGCHGGWMLSSEVAPSP